MKEKKNNSADLLKKLDKAVLANPKTFEPYFNRGSAKFYLGRFDESLKDFLKDFRKQFLITGKHLVFNSIFKKQTLSRR